VLPLLFRPYARLGQKSSSGLGLGLYLAREIVTAHGGTIRAESKLDAGTVIIVQLPLGKRALGRRKAHPDARPGVEAGA
jgi:signal transduction histidine kinase